MKKIFAFFVAVLFLSACSKKETITPDLVTEIDGKVMEVTSIKFGEIDIDRYVISGFQYNAGKPTLFEPKLNGGTSLLYKTTDYGNMEKAKLVETKTGLLNIQFKDENPNWIGDSRLVYVPEELKTAGIITYEPNYGNSQSSYYICLSEVLSGNYAISKTSGIYTLVRTEEPIITITMKQR